MSDTEFWDLVDKIDRSQIGELYDDEAALAPLIQELESLDAVAIEAFEEHLAAILYALDGKQYLAAAGVSQSGDSFLYARCWVVAQGRAHYEEVLADPNLMPKTVNEWFEPLLSAARAAYEKKTGKEWVYASTVSYESFSNNSQW